MCQKHTKQQIRGLSTCLALCHDAMKTTHEWRYTACSERRLTARAGTSYWYNYCTWLIINGRGKQRVHVTTDARSARTPRCRAHSGTCDHTLLSDRRLFSESRCLVFVRRPLWREVGCHLSVPAARQRFSRQVAKDFRRKLQSVKPRSNQLALWTTYRSVSFLEASGQLHAPAALPHRERAPGAHWIEECTSPWNCCAVGPQWSTYCQKMFRFRLQCSVRTPRYSQDGSSGWCPLVKWPGSYICAEGLTATTHTVETPAPCAKEHTICVIAGRSPLALPHSKDRKQYSQAWTLHVVHSCAAEYWGPGFESHERHGSVCRQRTMRRADLTSYRLCIQ
jgi:hypothetical protein